MFLAVLVVTFSVATTSVVTARDGCQEKKRFLCGDICIDQFKDCVCGNETVTGRFKDRDFYCCVPPGDDQCSEDAQGDGHCLSGERKGTAEICHGHCFNEYQEYSKRRLGTRSRYQCKSGQCVSIRRLCRDGYAACHDKSDLAECDEGVQCMYSLGESYTRALTSHYPHVECQYKLLDNDGIYDNIGRGDEMNLTSLVRTSPVNYTEVEECRDEDGNPGVRCGAKCHPSPMWCTGTFGTFSSHGGSCTTNTTQFSTADHALCGNTTFWKNVSCTFYIRPGSGEEVEVYGYGKRCSARVQHCYYPWYTTNHQDFGSKSIELGLEIQCRDLSDRMFHINTKCNMTAHLEEYCRTICGEENKHRHCRQSICDNREEWIANQTDPIIMDPHHCQSSCQTPGRDCEACTNTEQYFNCSQSGLCIHKDLLCDGHMHCQHGEDEEFDFCYPIYLNNKVIADYATLRCPHITYPEIDTLAVVCDGIPECVNSRDEPAICENSDVMIYITGSLIAIVVLWNIIESVVLDYHRRSQDDSDQSDEMVELNSNFSTGSNYKDFHQSPSFRRAVNILLAEIKYCHISADLKNVCKDIIKLEQSFHKHNENEVIRCLHQNLEPKLFGMIMDIHKPSFVYRKVKTLKKISERVEENEYLTGFLNVLSLVFTMMEILKDVTLVGTLVASLGGPQALFYYPEKFNSAIVFCLLVSILVPLIFSTLGFATEDPEVILKPYNITRKIKRSTLQAFVCLLSFLNPILLVNSKNENHRKMQKEKGAKLLRSLQEGARIKKQYVKYLKTELGLEMFYQLPTQILLLLVARTLTKTNGGLEAVFKKKEFLGMSADSLLVISTIWSFTTCVLLHRKQIKTDKEYLPKTSEVFVLLWGLFASAKRVMAIIAVFIPSLGLFSVLQHWQAEQMPYWIRMIGAHGTDVFGNVYNKIAYNDTLELNGLNKTVYWRTLDRTDWSDPSRPVFPPYTFYTGLTLGQTFVAFIALFILHFLVIILVKVLTTENIKNEKPLELLRHCLENMNIPVPYEDFDIRTGEISDYRARRRKVNREMLWIMMVNFTVNMLMLSPLIYTGLKIDKIQTFIILSLATNIFGRHLFLMDTIGTRIEEEESYRTVIILLVILTIGVVLCSVLEMVFYLLYNMKVSSDLDV